MPLSYDNLYFVYLMSQVKFIVCKYLIGRKTPKKLKVNSTKYNSLNSLKIKMKYKAFTKEKTKKNQSFTKESLWYVELYLFQIHCILLVGNKSNCANVHLALFLDKKERMSQRKVFVSMYLYKFHFCIINYRHQLKSFCYVKYN